MAPKDPAMLLSWINTQLRDFYPSLDELCGEASLSSIDYAYDPGTNQFI